MKNENLKIVEKKLPKLLVIGYGRHGKDTVCEILRDKYHFQFVSSSFFMCQKVIYPQLKEKYGYDSIQQCYDDRHNHRAEWFSIIAKTNEHDAATLGKAIFSEYDIYCGNRNAAELRAMREQGVYDKCLWVDACGRGMPIEDESSCTVTKHMADYIIYNNGTRADLEEFLTSQDFKNYLFNL
jgi:hypothetical protein